MPENFLTHWCMTSVEHARWPKYFSPQGFFPVASRLVPWLATGAFASCALGFYAGFFWAPVDARYGNISRIVYIHVPATWMSVILYGLLAAWAGAGLLFKARLAPMMVEALAPTGAMFAFLALWSGSLWGKPTWGIWWAWDMRLTAGVILLCLYLAVAALHAGMEDVRKADRIAALLALAGVMVVPVLLASVAVWPAHQDHSNPSTVSSTYAAARIAALIAVAAGFWMYSSAVVLMRLHCVILERERQSDWVARRVWEAR